MSANLKNLHIPAMPRIAREAMGILYKPEPDLKLLTRIISSDVGLSADIFRLANSAFCGSTKPTSELFTAITRIGLNALRQIVMTYAMATSFKLDLTVGIDNKSYWRHNAFVGQLAFELARKDHKELAHELQLAGLLHDAGIFVLSVNNPQRLRQLVSHCNDEKCDFVKAELALDQEPHRLLGARLASEWHLSPNVEMLIAFHDVADRHARGPLSEEQHRLVDLLILADKLAHRYGYGFTNYAKDTAVNADFLARLKIDTPTILTAVQSVKSFLEQFNS